VEGPTIQIRLFHRKNPRDQGPVNRIQINPRGQVQDNWVILNQNWHFHGPQLEVEEVAQVAAEVVHGKTKTLFHQNRAGLMIGTTGRTTHIIQMVFQRTRMKKNKKLVVSQTHFRTRLVLKNYLIAVQENIFIRSTLKQLEKSLTRCGKIQKLKKKLCQNLKKSKRVN
jgi:hypothetical protein